MEKKFAWDKGGGYVTLKCDGGMVGSQTIFVTSDVNKLNEERSISFLFYTTDGSQSVTLTLKQDANSKLYLDYGKLNVGALG